MKLNKNLIVFRVNFFIQRIIRHGHLAKIFKKHSLLSNTKLVSIGRFDLKPNHLLIIGVLALSFSISFLLRAQPADYGFELNEFDPFFNYRATQYMVDNGIDAYFQWHDDLSWHPTGRNVSHNSQVVLHLTAAITYWLFGGETDLYDFTILFPAVFGSLSAIVIFALVRVIGGTTAGLFAALFFSTSLAILVRQIRSARVVQI